MSEVAQHTEAPKRRWNWGWGIATVYTVFALGTLAFAYFSFSQKVELVSTDYYNKEVSFDQHASRVRNSQALTTPVQAHYDEQAELITLSFPFSGAHGSVQLYRPSESGQDQTLDVRCDERNQMFIPTKSLSKGLWRVKVEWDAAGKNYYDEFGEHI